MTALPRCARTWIVAGAMVGGCMGASPAPDATADNDPAAWASRGGAAIDAGNCSTGLALLRRAEDAGDRRAVMSLATLYDRGTCVEQDAARAFTLYRSLADSSPATAGVMVGYLYLHGLGVDRDAERADLWFRRAAHRGVWAGGEWGLAMAQIALGDRPVPEPLKRHFDRIDLIRESDPREQYRFALALMGDPLGPESLSAARYLLQRSYFAGVREAGFELGRMYFSGEGGRQVPLQGLLFLHGAASAGHRPAQVELARRYATADGTERSPRRAYFWLLRAGLNGSLEMRLFGEVEPQVDADLKSYLEDAVRDRDYAIAP